MIHFSNLLSLTASQHHPVPLTLHFHFSEDCIISHVSHLHGASEARQPDQLALFTARHVTAPFHATTYSKFNTIVLVNHHL